MKQEERKKVKGKRKKAKGKRTSWICRD